MENLQKMNTNLIRNHSRCELIETHEINMTSIANGEAPINTVKRRITQKNHQWHNIDWNKAEAKVRDIQEQIVAAIANKDLKEVYKLQWILIRKPEAQALAIRKVVTNEGGSTAGVDEIVWTSPQERWDAINKLADMIENNKKYEAQPIRRVYIPKPNSKEKRPLGIPTIADRAMQALYNFGVDPAVETVSDPNSYGFRKCRSTHDAITAIRSLLDKEHHPRWILEADISKCFDKIDHEFLLKHTPICHKHVLQSWLKSGIMEGLNYTEPEGGTPQGSIISPTLCNVALNGIEELIKKSFPLRKGISPGVHIIRYADDMIITGKTKEIVLTCKDILSKFLAERGLELNEKKTLITNIKEGFDFLGFNIKRQAWHNEYNNKTEQETVLIIKPSKKGMNKLMDTIKGIITINKPIQRIITQINPVLRGWGEHKRISYHSQAEFIRLDHWIYIKMKKWAYWQKGSIRKTINKYLVQTESRKWNWGLSNKFKIINLGEIPIIKMVPLKQDRNPYVRDNDIYFAKRKQNLIEAKFRALVYKKYGHKCFICQETLHNGEQVDMHHIIPRESGGKYSLENILPLHQICHQQVTYGHKSLERLRIALTIPTKKSRKTKEKRKTKSEGTKSRVK
jgi:RNA-directed DNA polymerase